MERDPGSEVSTAPLFNTAVTGDEKIDLALRTTEFDPSVKFTHEINHERVPLKIVINWHERK